LQDWGLTFFSAGPFLLDDYVAWRKKNYPSPSEATTTEKQEEKKE
jgi:hypothetical protein